MATERIIENKPESHKHQKKNDPFMSILTFSALCIQVLYGHHHHQLSSHKT
uniref:Uncharacterized protein n=1 Tax=Brassica oleracea TaxID=3712 RepID=A0A3P6DXS0_BRAOL|nr:unnamed protein product [Brassica oleracea]